jgi:hypothetical protein
MNLNEPVISCIEQFLARSRHKCSPTVFGSTIQLPIPEVDQGPLKFVV